MASSPLTKLSLFSGIGGDDLASDWAGIRTIAFVERDKYCQQVLAKHWPGVPIIGDVHEVTKARIVAIANQRRCYGEQKQQREEQTQRGWSGKSGQVVAHTPTAVDIISGGFPCQPHSVAGKRKGSGDERDLWPEFRRIIGEIRPRWVVAENVPGLFSSDAGRFFGTILADLAALGYSVGWCTFGAVDVGAWHRRDRVFIVAHTARGIRESSSAQSNQRRTEEPSQTIPHSAISGLGGAEPTRTVCAGGLSAKCRDVSDTQYQQLNRAVGRDGRWPESSDGSIWAVEPNVGRVAHGVSRRVDRLRALGNAVVPQQIYPIYKAIVECEAVQDGK
jgi:DNA (cytosine-5)-methyltransferase 1